MEYLILICLVIGLWVALKPESLQRVHKPCTCGQQRFCTSAIYISPKGGVSREFSGLTKCGKFMQHLKDCQKLQEKQEKDID